MFNESALALDIFNENVIFTEIIEDELHWFLDDAISSTTHLKRNQVYGPDGIVESMIIHSDDKVIDHLVKLFNKL